MGLCQINADNSILSLVNLMAFIKYCYIKTQSLKITDYSQNTPSLLTDYFLITHRLLPHYIQTTPSLLADYSLITSRILPCYS